MLVRLIYASRTKDIIEHTLVEKILTQAQVHNPENGITGLLCYADHTFVQVLEGGRAQVNRLFQRLAQDPRHHEVTLLDYQEITERRYANWSMGQVSLDNMNLSLILRYSECHKLDPFSMSGSSTTQLMAALADTGALSRS